MEYKVMVPSQIWQGYDPRLEPLKAVKTDYVYLFDLADCLTLSAEDWLRKAKRHETEQLEII